ncbi:MAG TPA: hypothetical protein VF517_18560 [Thermoleophilaceae bacterium]
MKRWALAVSVGAIVGAFGAVDGAAAACSTDARDRAASPSGTTVGAAGQSAWVNPSTSAGEVGTSTSAGSNEGGGGLSGGSAYYSGGDAVTGSYTEGSGSGSASTLSGGASSDGAAGGISSSGDLSGSPAGLAVDDVQAGAVCATP